MNKEYEIGIDFFRGSRGLLKRVCEGFDKIAESVGGGRFLITFIKVQGENLIYDIHKDQRKMGSYRVNEQGEVEVF